MVLCMQATGRCPGRSGKPLSAVSRFPDAPGSHCLLSVRSRTLREAAVCCQSVPGRSGKPLSAVSPFPDAPGSHCLLSVCSRKFREATVCCQSVAGRSAKPFNSLRGRDFPPDGIRENPCQSARLSANGVSGMSDCFPFLKIISCKR
jgi:hypothetical protein